MIKLELIGNLGRDAEVKQVSDQNAINFSVASTEKFRDSKGEQREVTKWVDCVMWVKKDAISTYLKKGTQVFIEGTPDVRAWLGSDGTARATQTLRVKTIKLLGAKTHEDRAENAVPPAAAEITEPLDDLPF